MFTIEIFQVLSANYYKARGYDKVTLDFIVNKGVIKLEYLNKVTPWSKRYHKGIKFSISNY